LHEIKVEQGRPNLNGQVELIRVKARDVFVWVKCRSELARAKG